MADKNDFDKVFETHSAEYYKKLLEIPNEEDFWRRQRERANQPRRILHDSFIPNLAQIKNICKNWNVPPHKAVLFNNDWIVSNVGDMIGGRRCGSYAIFSYHLQKLDIAHLYEKVWFDPVTFVPAYLFALCKAGIDYAKPLLQYPPNEHGEYLEFNPIEVRNNDEFINKMIDLINNYMNYD